MSRLRIVVTGTTGQTVRALGEVAEPDIEIIPVGRPALDLNLPETIETALVAAKPDLIVNAAAYTAVDKAESEIELAASVNSMGAGTVAGVARALNVPLIHLSTDYVFDGEKKEPYLEEDPAKPTSVYGMTKWVGERAVQATWGDYVVLRTSWFYAPYGKNFVRTMLNLIGAGKPLRVVGDQVGTPTYAPDLARAILRLARNLLADPDRGRGVFHFSGAGPTVSWAGFAAAIITDLALRGFVTPSLTTITTAEYPTPAPRPANSRLDCRRLRYVHEITAPDWRESLTLCLNRLLEGAEMERV
jgi:dTDP-4-dehydrorhamnose reductase